MKTECRSLADGIDQIHAVKTVNIYCDTNEKETSTLLEICLHHLKEKGLVQNSRLDGHAIKKASSTYKTETIWVIYGAFECISRITANECVPEYSVTTLKTQLNNKDILEISIAFSRTTPYVYKDEQLKEY